MKRTLIFILSIMLMFSLAASVSAAESGKNIGTLPGTAEKLALDGKKDAAYKNALHINEMVSHDGKATPLAKTDFYLLYDRDAIWVFCEVEDATLTTKAADPKQPNYKVDSIEIMLDMTNKGENIADQTPLQCRLDHNNQVSGRLGQKGTSLFLRESEGGTVGFFDAAAVKTDKGFNAEFRIPFRTAPEKGGKIGINLCYNDWDKDDGTRIFLVSTPGVSSWNVDKFDYVTLGGITDPKPGSSAETSDPLTIVTICALISGAAFTASKRKSRVRSAGRPR